MGVRERPSLRPRLEEWFELGGSRSRIPAMEGVRGIAILLVYFVHFFSLFAVHLPAGDPLRLVLERVGDVGNSGVDLFFVLSGALIYGTVVEREVAFRRFARRRVERIYPAFLVVFAVYLALSLAVPGESKIPPGLAAIPYLVANVLLLPGLFPIVPMITVAWSLSYEIFFYLAVPPLVSGLGLRRWPRRRRATLVLLASLAHLVLAGAGVLGHPRLAMFGAGMLLHEALASPGLKAKLASAPAVPVLGAALGLLALFGHRSTPSLIAGGEAQTALGVAFLYVGFLAYALAAFAGGSWLARAMSVWPLRWLGNMSYSYYLLHGLTMKAVALLTPAALVAHPLGIALLLPLVFLTAGVTSGALYVLVERRYSLAEPKAAPG